MVGIVVVAHSAKLAEGVRELAEQMVRERVPIAVAGGIDDADHPFGTDVMRVHQAIEAVYSDDGVVVLMDLGSSLLSAEMALEFLPEEQRTKIRLCAAPLVEGAIAAAVQSEAGSSLEQVIAEAQGALGAKKAQLQTETPELSPSAPAELTTPLKEKHLIIHNRLGLHARPAAQFVTTAARFLSDITVRNITRNTGAVNAKSINQVATLGVRQGHEIVVTATGSDADEALVALKALVEYNFNEPEVTPERLPELQATATSPLVEGELTGIPASPGIAIGPAVRYHPPVPKVPEQHIDDPQAEWQRLQTALQTARDEIQVLRTRTAAQAGDYEAAIFDAHLLFLADPILMDSVRQRIFAQRLNAEASWQTAVDEMIAQYHTLEDSYLRTRAADVADVRDRVLRLLAGIATATFALPNPSILVAADLTPSDIMQLDPQQILGICTAWGGVTSHSAILARALAIPAVVGVGPGVLHVTEGTLLALDGQQGRVWVNPDNVAVLQKQREAWLISQQAARAASQQPAVTRDGQRITVAANIRGIADVRVALEHGAEGVGLLRTEFLYLNRINAPSEEEQLAAYNTIAELLGPRPLIIRTLDVGGDKLLPYLDLQRETNPFLGWRGIRLCLDHLDLFKTQLRAILRVSFEHQVKVMFPMISSVEEVRRAKEILIAAQAELRQTDIPFDESMAVGIMVEVPSAVAMADQLASEVDFFSIGTNDLSQYTMAADRTNDRVVALTDALHPAVLRLIRHTVQAGHAAGIWVGLCGELAGNPLATPILLGLKLDELSMNPPAIPFVKQTMSQLTLTEAETVAEEVVNLDSAEAVRHYIVERFSHLHPSRDR